MKHLDFNALYKKMIETYSDYSPKEIWSWLGNPGKSYIKLIEQLLK